MSKNSQYGLFSNTTDLDLMRLLLVELHDDLDGKIGRFHQLMDLSQNLGEKGTLIPGGEVAYAAWLEARSSFVHGNYVATVLLCQSLAEQMLAANLTLDRDTGELPERVSLGVSGFLCEEPYTAREGEEEVWPRTIRRHFLQSFWTSCWLAVIPSRYWILAA